MTVLWIITGAALLTSLAADRRKTRTAVVRGLRMLANIAPTLVGVLAVVSLVMAAATPGALTALLSGQGPLPFFIALVLGAVVLMPGFVAYPLASVLQQNGASVATLAAFITSLMMVGVLTLPLEARFFGWRVSILRNVLALGGALVVAAAMTWLLT